MKYHRNILMGLAPQTLPRISELTGISQEELEIKLSNARAKDQVLLVDIKIETTIEGE